MDVLGIEHQLVGGECPYWGCIPSKIMVRAGNSLAEAGRAGRIAGRGSVTPDWSLVAGRIRQATADWDDEIAIQRFEKKGGTSFAATPASQVSVRSTSTGGGCGPGGGS